MEPPLCDPVLPGQQDMLHTIEGNETCTACGNACEPGWAYCERCRAVLAQALFGHPNLPDVPPTTDTKGKPNARRNVPNRRRKSDG